MPAMTDPFGLNRFVAAQDSVIVQVRAELQVGYKRSHWMWFIFPQLVGLGRSSTAQRYAISSLEEARSYLAHSVLGPRLIECTVLVNGIENRTAHQIFGTPDDLKFHSSMTLFGLAKSDERAFSDALEKYFGGITDRLTAEKLSSL
jgi:uncharacterized protein (DUF1810 family)